MSLYIIGSGMAGLLCANMLRKHKPTVLEAQANLPHNHSAVLRFGSSAVADVLGIPFRKVNMIKATLPWINPVADAMAYAKKNLSRYESDRSVSRSITSAERWIAPQDLISRMAEDVKIKFNIPYDFRSGRPKVISTIPMPALMHMLDYPRHKQIDFRYSSGVNVRGRVKNCDAFVTLNVPHPETPYSRVSITGDELIVEFPNTLHVDANNQFLVNSAVQAATLLGVHEDDVCDLTVAAQKYHKIGPIDERERKEFVHWASAIKGVAWQVGRFATWRPGLQLDDLVKDIRLIERWMTQSRGYEMGHAGYEMEKHRGDLR